MKKSWSKLHLLHNNLLSNHGININCNKDINSLRSAAGINISTMSLEQDLENIAGGKVRFSHFIGVYSLVL